MRINLLPYRQEKTAALRKRFKMLSILFGAITIALSIVIYFYFVNLSNIQKSRNEMLSQSNDLMDKKISKIKSLKEKIAYLKEEQDLIEKLKTDRYNGIILLKELALALPDGVYLTKFTQRSINSVAGKGTNQSQSSKNEAALSNGFQLTIEGSTLSNVRVATFVNSLNASSYFENALLSEVKLDETPSFIRNSKFLLTVQSRVLIASSESPTFVEKASSSNQKDSPFVEKTTDSLKKMTESVTKNPGESQ